MATKKTSLLIGIVLAVSVNPPRAFAQSASTDTGQARYLASSNCNAPQRHETSEARRSPLLFDSIPTSNAIDGNLLLSEDVNPDSHREPQVEGKCGAKFIESNPKMIKGGEWVLDGTCFEYPLQCLIFQDNAQCPPGAKALDPVHESCGSLHKEVDLSRRCQGGR